MSASTTELNSTQTLNFNTDRAAAELSRRKSKITSDTLASKIAERESLVPELTRNLVQFGELAFLHGHDRTGEGELSPPFEFTEHRKFYDSYRHTELVCYFVSLLLLAAQTWLTLSYDWPVKLAIIAAGFLLVWKLFPALIWTAFDVDQRQPDSVKPVKKTFIAAAVLALLGLFAFALTRSTDETGGAWVMLYNNSLVLAELGFAICGACAHVMKRFYEWSIVYTRDYTSLDQQLQSTLARIVELEAGAGTNPANHAAEESDYGEK